MDDQTGLSFAQISHTGEGEIMSTLTKRTRKQIERHIEQCAESIQKNGLEIGRDLIEIRDGELWADEYSSWNQYLKDRVASIVGKSFAQATNLIRAAEIETRIPEKISLDVKTNLGASHLSELGRLVPAVGKEGTKGAEKDYSKLRKQDVARVIKAATEIAKESAPPEKKAEATPSVRDIRKAVDAELGLDRSKQAKESKQERERASQIDLFQYISRMTGTIEGWLSVLHKVPSEGWEFLSEETPEVLDEVRDALAELAGFLQS